VRSQRFDEAIVLGEDVMRRYPLSPQADSLEMLLPRLRELANGGVREFAPLAPEPDTELDIDEEEAQHRLA
jgi:hypothetical protein